MKYKWALFLLITPLLLGATPNRAVVQTVNPSTPRIGPFQFYQDDVESHIALKSTLTKSTVIYEKVMYKDMNTNQTRTDTLTAHTIGAGATVRVPITIPTSKYFGFGGMRMAIGVFRASDDYEYKTVSSIIY